MSLEYPNIKELELLEAAITARDAVLLVSHGGCDPSIPADVEQIAGLLREQTSASKVVPCYLRAAQPSLLDAISTAADEGIERVWLLPLLLLAARHLMEQIPAIVEEARRSCDIAIHTCSPIGAHPAIVALMALRFKAGVRCIGCNPSETALLVVGSGTRDAEANADVFKLARLIHEACDARWAEVAFCGNARPAISEGVARCVALGARALVVVPYLIYAGAHLRQVTEEAQEAAMARSLPIAAMPNLGPCDAVVAALAARLEEARKSVLRMTCERCMYRAAITGDSGWNRY